MACDNDWTVRFPNIVTGGDAFEIRPISLNLQINRTDYSFCRAKFHTDVGKEIKPHTRETGSGLLSGMHPVEVCCDGDPVQTLLFKADFAQYGTSYTHLEFEDLHYALDTGTIDATWQSTEVRDMYERIFEKRENKDVVTDIEFGIPEGDENVDSLIPAVYTGASIVGASQTLDLEQVSPLEAILRVHEITGLSSWFDEEGTMFVGKPEEVPQYHIAAPDDPRVWRYNSEEVSIRHPREPIYQVVVQGGWVDEAGVGGHEDAISFFNPWSSDGALSAGDFKAHGHAWRTDVPEGRTKYIQSDSTDTESLEATAASQLHESAKQSHSGRIEINVQHSGEYTPLTSPRPGDWIHVVPSGHHIDPSEPDFGLQKYGYYDTDDSLATAGEVGEEPHDLGGCNTFVNNDIYLINDVRHNLNDNGTWSITLDIGAYPDFTYKTTTRYFDPHNEEYVDESNVYGNQWLEDDRT